MSPSSIINHGQVIEYFQDRLYLASYSHPPDDLTPFPYATTNNPRSPGKRVSKSQQGTAPITGSRPSQPPLYFSVDDTLLYNAFHADFGPLHIGHLYRFAVQLHEILGDSANEGRSVVFWSKSDPRSRANAACLLACYMVLIQSWPPHLALAPIAQADPPMMPFRDAGYSQADYSIAVQDVVYGVWRAKEEHLCGLRDFSLEEYEKYERVDMGDFNWVTPSFLAFASPQHSPTAPIPSSSPQFAALPKTVSALAGTNLPQPFKNVLSHFVQRNIGLVVRLNSELYSPSYFTALGIHHIDMIFEDGTCPPLPLVRKFIKLAHDMITVKHKSIAVHCKAGLGRTGCLIGAYLIYRHGFTANEIIAFMRFMRPGMVVGPQQHWLHLNQGTFREWWFEDSMRQKMALALPVTPTKISQKLMPTSSAQVTTPVNGSHTKRAPLTEVDHNEASTNDDNLPAPTPGQPRKTARIGSDRHHPYSRNVSNNHPMSEARHGRTSVEVTATHRQTQGESESDEEFQLRLLARRMKSHSPNASEKRAASYTTTTVTSTTYNVNKAEESDIENRISNSPQRPKTPSHTKSGSGAGALGIMKTRSSPKRTSEKGILPRDSNGVRKTSGRVGSVGAITTAARRP